MSEFIELTMHAGDRWLVRPDTIWEVEDDSSLGGSWVMVGRDGEEKTRKRVKVKENVEIVQMKLQMAAFQSLTRKAKALL